MQDEFSPSQFLRSDVYPRIDAVAAGLLDNLAPMSRSSNGSYVMHCPRCKKKEAFYYPGSGYINCPRKENCGEPTSIWDALLFCDFSQKEIFTVLCSAAGVEPPKRDKSSNRQKAPDSEQISIGKAAFRITQAMAKANADVMNRFQNERGYSDQQMATMRLGYYSTPEEFLKQLSAYGFTIQQAASHGYVEFDEENPKRFWSNLSGRIVGYWPHADGQTRLWGRLPTGAGSSKVAKYKFSPTLKKDIPYLFNLRKQTVFVCVEGTLDAWALQHACIWGAAIGGASINSGQALFLSKRGISEVAHMVDGDNAGWNGAITTIRNCEALGIVTSIIPLGSGMDDADAMYRAGKADQLHKMVHERMNAGMYLALMLKGAYAQNELDLQLISRVFRAVSALTTTSRNVFHHHTAILGLSVDLREEASRQFASLILSGCTFGEAAMLVKRKTGYTISINKTEEENA